MYSGLCKKRFAAWAFGVSVLSDIPSWSQKSLMPSLLRTSVELRAFCTPARADWWKLCQTTLSAATLAWLFCGALSARAQSPALPDVAAVTQRWLDDALARTQSAELPLRMEASVGQLDPRLRLAPCGRIEPYLPTGVRLWGRARIGLRCVDGVASWSVFLPVTIKAYGPVWVLNANVAPGTVLTAADAVQSEADWAADAANVLVRPEQWVGQQASRPLVGGQVLRQSMVRPAPLFAAGASVRVVVQGKGYAVTATGQALNAAGIGQSVRVRMESGRLVSGVVRESGVVEVAQ